MRIDKSTTKFQQALADAQSLAVGNDQQFVEARHVLLALIDQEDGSARSLLARAGVNVNCLKKDLEQALKRLPKVEGHGGDVTIGRDLTNPFNLTDKEAQKRGDQFIASEMFLLALADDKGETGRLAKQHGLARKALEAAILAVRGGQGVDSQEWPLLVETWAPAGSVSTTKASFVPRVIVAQPETPKSASAMTLVQILTCNRFS